MKQALAYLLILVILFQTVSKLGYIVHYKIKKDYIAKNLCENRNKPAMNCKGKCHLKKQLAQAEKNESQGKTDSKEKWEDLFCVTSVKTHDIAEAIPLTYFAYDSDFLPGYASSIYHPPKI